jgi:hypothetical protein
MAASVFGKLNLKDQAEIVVINAPESFEPELARLRGVTIRRELSGLRIVTFALVFATRKAEIGPSASSLSKVAEGDAIVWFAYPKGSSKRYDCDFNRDTGWDALGVLGFAPVRQVAVDEDWSALRFRRVEFVKTLRRPSGRVLPAGGKKKVRSAR